MGWFTKWSRQILLGRGPRRSRRRLRLGAPESIQLTKRLLNETIGEHLGTLLTVGASDTVTARTTEAAREGLAAFGEAGAEVAVRATSDRRDAYPTSYLALPG